MISKTLILLALLCALPGCGDTSAVPTDGASDGDPGADVAAPKTRGPRPWKADMKGEDKPSLVALGAGRTCVAWQAFKGDHESIELGLLTDLQNTRRVIHEAPAHVMGTAIARDDSGALRVVWSERRSDGWAIVERRVPVIEGDDPLGAAGTAQDIVARVGAQLITPRMASDDDGRLLLIYQVIEGEDVTFEAVTATSQEPWSEPLVVPERQRSNWFPALCSRGAGRFAVVWDRAVDGDYDVLLAEVEADAAGVRVVSRSRVTDTPRHEAHASVAAHGERLYVAYEVGQEQWGREGSTKKLGEALHSQRAVEVLAVEGGRVAHLEKPFMQRINPNLARGCERPTVLVDGNGNLVLGFRGLPLPPDLQDPDSETFQGFAEDRAGGGVGWRSSIWFGYMSIYDGRGWSYLGTHHSALPDTEGRCDAELALAHLPKGGVVVATVGDRRERESVPEGSLGKAKYGDGVSWWKPICINPHRVTGVRIGKGSPVDALPVAEWSPLPALRDELAVDALIDERHVLADGTELRLALGDLHRHTDISRCSSNWDGPFTDAVRYAFDVGGLHYLAVTDHFEHMTAYDWWRNVGFMEAYNAPGRMVELVSYERADNMTGHRNVITGADDLPIAGYRNHFHPPRDELRADLPPDLWPLLEGLPILTIPHTTAGMFKANPSVFDWLGFEPKRDRVVELFQGYRGSSEVMGGPKAIDVPHEHRFAVGALNGGLHFGFVAGSDHQSTFGSFAGAWTTSLTRSDIFDALWERRSFAATCQMSLWVEWDGVPLGIAAQREPGPTSGVAFDVTVWGRELALAELIVDGQVARRRELSGTSASGVFETVDVNVPDEGTRYTYIRITTDDDELGWSSPIRLGPDPDYGPDGPPGKQGFGQGVGQFLELRPSTGSRAPNWERWEGPDESEEGGGG